MNFLKFSLPYRYKFIIFFVILTVATLFSFLGVSLQSFGKDKTSYVFDYILNTSQTKIGHLESLLKDMRSSVTLYIYRNKKIELTSDIKFVAILENDHLNIHLGQKHESLEKEIRERSKAVSELILKKSILTPLSSFPDLYYLIFKNPFDNSLIITGFKRNLIQDLFENERGQFSFIYDGENIITSKNAIDRDFNPLLNLPHGKIQRIKVKNESYYAVLNSSKLMNQSLVTALREQDLFEFLREIRLQNIALAALIISLSSIMGILFAKKLTRSINLLISASNQVSSGDLDVKFEKIESGEIGVLQSTFLKMAEAVKFSLLREREHQRIENDLKIARLVQETFFPSYEMKDSFSHVACYYGPANECSGDWWGFFEIDHYQYYFMGDATGHGVSSALITAKAYSLIYGLKNQMLNKQILPLEPAQMMESLNQVLCSSKQVLMMTFFIMRIDKRSRDMMYCNASHEIPILITKDGESKDIFEPGSMPDSRLGQEMEASFKNYLWKLNGHDIILLYTDGLTECSNPKGKFFGSKRVTMALKKMKDQGPPQMITGLVEEIKNFSQAESFEDDVGLMLIKILQEETL